MTDEKICDCGAPVSAHDSTNGTTLEHVNVTSTGDWWCLRTNAGEYIADDGMQPEDAILVRDLAWAVNIANELAALRKRCEEAERDLAFVRDQADRGVSLSKESIAVANRANAHAGELQHENAALRAQVAALTQKLSEAEARAERVERNFARCDDSAYRLAEFSARALNEKDAAIAALTKRAQEAEAKARDWDAVNSAAMRAVMAAGEQEKRAATLRVALEQWKCGDCEGAGWNTEPDRRGEPTQVQCETCLGTGTHPTALAALEATK